MKLFHVMKLWQHLVLVINKQAVVQKPLRCSVEILPVLWESRELKNTTSPSC